ncbi:unnamed protein product, partial [marine sediment metagenome]
MGGESKDLNCDYLGKDDSINLLIPSINNKIKLIREVIERTQAMNDEAFNKLRELTIHKMKREDITNNENVNIAFFILQRFRENQKDAMDYNFHLDDTSLNEQYEISFNYNSIILCIFEALWFLYTI